MNVCPHQERLLGPVTYTGLRVLESGPHPACGSKRPVRFRDRPHGVERPATGRSRPARTGREAQLVKPFGGRRARRQGREDAAWMSRRVGAGCLGREDCQESGGLTVFRTVGLVTCLDRRMCSGNARRPKPARGLRPRFRLEPPANPAGGRQHGPSQVDGPSPLMLRPSPARRRCLPTATSAGRRS